MHLSQGNVRSLPLLPLPVQTTWSTIPQPTSPHIPSVPFPQLPEPGLMSPQCATNPVHTQIPPTLSADKLQSVNAVSAGGGSHLNDQISSYSSQQLQVGAVGEHVRESLNQGSSVSAKVSPPLCVNVQENSESVLPGIETLLNAIQVVEGQEDDSSAKNQAAYTFTKFTALNSPHSDETRLDLDPGGGGGTPCMACTRMCRQTGYSFCPLCPNFVRVCQQGIACTIGLICKIHFVCAPNTKAYNVNLLSQ